MKSMFHKPQPIKDWLIDLAAVAAMIALAAMYIIFSYGVCGC